MSLVDPFLQAGMGDPLVSTETEFQWGPIATWQMIAVVLDSTARDVGNTPTTTLRRGLTIAQIAATGKFKQYDPTAADGSQIAKGFLYQGRNLLDPRTAVAGDRQGTLVFYGNVKAGMVFGLDEQARRQLQDQIIFDDRNNDFGPPLQVVPQIANYQVVNGVDNGKYFTNAGATGSVTFTLPATIQRGHVFRFSVEADFSVSIVAPAGALVTTNNATATSITFSTAGQRIGSSVEITVNAAGTKYVAHLLTPNTATIA